MRLTVPLPQLFWNVIVCISSAATPREAIRVTTRVGRIDRESIMLANRGAGWVVTEEVGVNRETRNKMITLREDRGILYSTGSLRARLVLQREKSPKTTIECRWPLADLIGRSIFLSQHSLMALFFVKKYRSTCSTPQFSPRSIYSIYF